MADPRSNSDTDDDTGTPRWVKVFGIIFFVVVLMFLILMFTRGPHRGSRDHTSSRDHSGHTTPRSSH